MGSTKYQYIQTIDTPNIKLQLLVRAAILEQYLKKQYITESEFEITRDYCIFTPSDLLLLNFTPGLPN